MKGTIILFSLCCDSKLKDYDKLDLCEKAGSLRPWGFCITLVWIAALGCLPGVLSDCDSEIDFEPIATKLGYGMVLRKSREALFHLVEA